MLTFTEFLAEAARNGEAVNTLFEERLFELTGILHRITDVLAEERIPYELIGGLAVLIHVEQAHPEHATLTRDVDLMVWRADLERIKEAAGRSGFRFRHTAGLDTLLYGDADSARNAVNLLFSGEKVQSVQAVANPPIQPECKSIHGHAVMVVPVGDLLRMKLSAFRLKDQVHVKAMDAAGLITPAVEEKLAPEFATRLQLVRETA